MATGKELVRMMECGIWKEQVEENANYRWSQIFDAEGNPITKTVAKTKTFCHARILFKLDDAFNETSVKLMETLLRNVASTSSEHMGSDVFDCYGFVEIIIC